MAKKTIETINENAILVKDIYIEFKDVKNKIENIFNQLDEKTKTSNKLYIEKLTEVLTDTEEVLKNIDDQMLKQDIKNVPIFISIQSLIEELKNELNNTIL